MIIVNLNIRGLGGSTKASYLRRIVAKEGAAFVCLQETKLRVCTDARCYGLWGDNNVGWVHFDGENGSGSLLSMWRKDVFVYESHEMGKGFIAVVGQHAKSSCRCVIVNVYAACSLREKIELWERLSTLKLASSVLAWCFCGDFNAIRRRGERKGTSVRENHTSEMGRFNNFIDTNTLLELPIVGKKYTWFSSNGKAMSRLDRVLVSEEWMQEWPMGKQYVQRREISDHCALVVKSVVKDWGPKPFRTIDAWFMERGFMDMVKDRWASYPDKGNAFMAFKEKLKCLKGDLKIWNRDVFGILESTKKNILEEIEMLDCQACSGTLDDGQNVQRLGLVSRLKETDRRIESLLSQKARTNWLKNGDYCTKFYHSSLRWRRLRNGVKGVEVGGQWCEEPCTVRGEAKKFFESRFAATKDFGVRLDGVEIKSLSLDDSVSLIREFSVEEVKEAVWLCEGSKSPGPDGFNFNFIKKSWEFIEGEVMTIMNQFHDTGVVPKGCNASFIALVPKVRDPVTLDNYRPISLVGAIYKIISKVLAGRFRTIITSIIDDCQSAFVKGRGILDSVLMANEVVEDMRRNGGRGLCLKVDFEKAYDSVRWEFLYDMLLRMGFQRKWISWIRGCMESSTVSVLVNGSPTEEFKPARGLRQGDPLAPFLFIVVAEGLASLVRQAVRVNLLTGLKIGRKEVEVSILQFADDTMFFCEESYSNVVTLNAILRGFEVASGLKINFHKSKLTGINVRRSDLECYAKTLNCVQMEVPFKYLGLEVGGNPRKTKFWEPVLNKLKDRLNVWKGRWLSLAGRVCLLKSVLTSVPLYYLSL